MFAQIATIAFTATFIATTTASDGVWNSIVTSGDINTSSNLPQTYKEAKNRGWINIEGVNTPEWIYALAFKGDPTFVLLFHEGKVIGFQVAIPVTDIQNLTQPLQWDELDVIITKTLINNELFYTATVYFYQNKIENIRRLWFQEKKNSYNEIPTTVDLVSSETNFTMKNCVPTIGTYYYSLDFTTDCAIMNPWVLLAEGENIIGVCFQAFGKPTTIGDRIWWETISLDELKKANPDFPPCACDAAEEFGIFSLHVWFRDGPQNITCN